MTHAAFADCIDLANAALGGVALACSDDFFASMDNLLKSEPAVFDPNAYTERGKLMDGWESRRKRDEGHDWLILRLGVPGTVRGFDVDTSHFLGNQPPFCTIDGCVAPAETTAEQLQAAPWTEILPQVPLEPGSHNLFAAARVERWTHLRLNILPDGGVARLRVFGLPSPALPDGEFDVAALVHGGRAIAASDMFFGDRNNLLRPGRAANMGGGWETRRRRDDGHDWVVVQLAGRARLSRVVADTHHFKGNFPHRIAIDGIDAPDAGAYLIHRQDWTPVVDECAAAADHAHAFDDLLTAGPFTHVRLRVHPCGGVSRLRVFGELVDPAQDLAALLNGLSDADAREALLRCCGSEAWADAMVAARPFADPTAVRLAADEVWWTLDEDDHRQAFAHHPRIGEDPERLRAKFASTSAWAGSEQGGVASASEATLAALQQANVDYEARFGHVFLICATGLTADQMLAALRRRLPHDARREHLVAAGEQAKITRLRLDKLVG
jgi:allantoicase